MKRRTKATIAIVVGMILFFTPSIQANRYMERLGRGVVAVRTGSSQAYIGWRMLGTDPNDIAFNLYRSTGGGTPLKLNSQPITQSTNWVDNNDVNLIQSNSYFVRPVLDGQELAPSTPFTLPANAPMQQYISIPLAIPAGGTTPDGASYTHRANDASVGDLDGDGEYEIILKWDPSNAKDNSQSGYTGNVFLDAYKLNGIHLWRVDLGINIRAGAHYTQFMVYDLDGDGRAEVACKTAPGTVDGQGHKVILPGDDPNVNYRNPSGSKAPITHNDTTGYVLSGPEYLTIFDGLTGKELATKEYIPLRGDVNDWGDDYGNRVDRFLACVAYLDGVRPSLVMCRGYYGPMTSYGFKKVKNFLVAWNWRNGTLSHLWTFEAAAGQDGDINSGYVGQGNHSLSVSDVDSDGKDEIVYGACVIDHNGTGLYTTGKGHGNAMHLGDFDPDRPGMEVWQGHESSGGGTFRDARTGTIIFRYVSSIDMGRACAGDIDPRYRGCEVWGSMSCPLYSCKGQTISSTKPSMINFMVWWDADLLRELLDGHNNDMENQSAYNPPAVTTPPWIGKWNYVNSTTNTIFTADGTYSNNNTKATPCLSADILGDWREEVIWRTSDNTALRIYTTTIPATNRIYTLMHDPQYRLSIAWQNVTYNQPPHPGFYLGDGMAEPPRPQIKVLYGDLTGDNVVDINNMSEFSKVWLATDCNNVELDWNSDCIINFYEFSLLAKDWLEGLLLR